MSEREVHKSYENGLELPPLKGASAAQIDFANNRRIAAIRKIIKYAHQHSWVQVPIGTTDSDSCQILQNYLNKKNPSVYSVTQAADWLDVMNKNAGILTLGAYFDNTQTFQAFIDELKPKPIPPEIMEFYKL